MLDRRKTMRNLQKISQNLVSKNLTAAVLISLIIFAMFHYDLGYENFMK